MFLRTGNDWAGFDRLIDEAGGSIETLGPPIDKYDIPAFARDDFPRFMSLVEHLSPRDQEIILCFALLQKRPTDLSILFGKAGHRAERDLHKAAHKLAGLAEFGATPTIEAIDAVLSRANGNFMGRHNFAACLWEYAKCRDFTEMSRLIGHKGLRAHMLRAFHILHAAKGREEGLLAGWILWLVDGSNPDGKGWKKRKRTGREHKLGPISFHTLGPAVEQLTQARAASQKGGQRQRTSNVKIKRRLEFLLKGK